MEDIMAVNADMTLRSRKTASHNVHGGGFPSAVWPQEAIYVPLLDLKGEILDRHEITVAFCQVFHCDHALTSLHSSLPGSGGVWSYYKHSF